MLSKIKRFFNDYWRKLNSWLKDKTKYSQHLLVLTLLIVLILVVIFTTTNPNNIGPVGMLGVMFLLYVLFATIILLFRIRSAGKFTTADHKKLLIFRSALDATPLITLVGLNTLRQLTWSDVVIVPLFYLIFKFYAHRQFGL